MIPLLIPLDWMSDIGSFFSTILSPIYYAISWLLMVLHSFWSLFLNPDWGWTWALSIVLLTILVRSALVPLFVKQITSARNMQLLQPKIKELQAKYGSDRERLGQETMKLYKDEGVNPMASCFPILLQMPIFFSLFWVLRDVSFSESTNEYKGIFENNHALAVSLRNADLFGAKISQTFWPFETWGAVQTLGAILIVAMTCTLFVTQLQLMRKNMPPESLTGPMAQQQKMMLFLFPVMYLFGGAFIPIGVMIYWLTTNLWTMGQQYVLIRNNPAPNTPAFIDWEERMIAKGKDPQEVLEKRRGKQRPTPRQSSDPNKVTRQSSAPPEKRRWEQPPSTPPAKVDRQSNPPASKRSTKATPPPTPQDTDAGQKIVIKRQQPLKSSRSARKKTGGQPGPKPKN